MIHQLTTLTNMSGKPQPIPGCDEDLAPDASVEVATEVEREETVALRLRKSILQVTGRRLFDDEEEPVDTEADTAELEPVTEPEPEEEPEERLGLKVEEEPEAEDAE